MVEVESVERREDRSEAIATKVNNLILYGVYTVLGEGARGLGNYIGEILLQTMLDEFGLNFSGSDDPQELLNRFTEVMINEFGFAKKGEVEIKENSAVLRLIDPMDLYALNLLKKRGMTPVVYPMANAVVAAIRNFSGKKAIINNINVAGDSVTVEIKILGGGGSRNKNIKFFNNISN